MTPKTWAIVGASRGIGHEFVRQILDRGEHVVATVRKPSFDRARLEWSAHVQQGSCTIFECDMLSESSIDAFVTQLSKEQNNGRIDYLVLNAGVLDYPNKATEMSYSSFAHHLHTNTIGPIICAQRLLASSISIGTIVFISSDSGSAQNFLSHEDGFAAYAASKAALNQALRHMAAELQRKGSETIIIALHPGEVATEMAVDLPWEVHGQMTPRESVTACIAVVESKSKSDSGTFWTWENKPYAW